jgi:hypothetical protein
MWIGLIGNLPDPILSALLTGGVGLAGYLLRPRARIHFAVTHGFSHTIRPQQQTTPPSPNIIVNTQTFTFRNSGRGVARDLEIVFDWKPLQYELWPQRSYREEHNPDGRLVLKVESLNPREFFAVEVIDTKNLPSLLSVRCLDGQSRAVDMVPTRIFPMWFNIGAAFLLLLGVYQIVQIVIGVVRQLFHVGV